MIKEKISEILKDEAEKLCDGVKPVKRIDLEEKKLINKWFEKIFSLMEESYDSMIEFSNSITVINDIFRRAVEDEGTYETDLRFCEKNVNSIGDYSYYNKELTEKFKDVNSKIIREFKILENELGLLYYAVKSLDEWDKCCKRFEMFRLKIKDTLIGETTKIFNSFTEENDTLIISWRENFEKLREIVELEEKEEAIKIAEEDKIEDKIKLNYKASYREIEKLAKKHGFEFKGVGRHHNFINDAGKKIPIPHHSKDLGKGISLKIQKEIIEC